MDGMDGIDWNCGTYGIHGMHKAMSGSTWTWIDGMLMGPTGYTG